MLFIKCFGIGLLTSGIVLAVITTIWLTHSTDGTTSSTLSQSSFISTDTTTTVTTATTTVTTVTTATTTTTSTPTPPCPVISIGSSAIIYNASSENQTLYVCHALLWQSPFTKTVNLTFQLQNRPYYWLVDDISVHDGGREMLGNGDFETGSLAPWIRTDPYGPCNGSAGRADRSNPRQGSYHLLDGSDNCPDLVSQSLSVTIGQLYTISFWLKVVGTGPDIHILVTIG